MADRRRIVTISPSGTVTTVKDFMSAGANEVQGWSLTGSSGTFTLTFRGETTAALAYNASNATIQSALQGLNTVGAGNVVVAGTLASSQTFTFLGALAEADQPLIVADRSGVVGLGGSPIAVITEGQTPGQTLTSVRGSFSVKPSQRKVSWAQRSYRYGGAVAAGESHDNGVIEWDAMIRGTSPDDVNSKLESALSVLENAQYNYFFEWRPDGATNSVYYEIRGPATWDVEYDWITYATTNTISCKISIPVGPLARGAVGTQALASSALPLHYTSLTSITGSAPALCDVSLRFSGGALAPIWMLMGWAKRPTTPLSGSVAPFGIIEAETASSLSVWASSLSDADYRGSNGIRATASGAGAANAGWLIDPSTMQPDDFTAGTIDIEVWARAEISYQLLTPRFILSAAPELVSGTSYGSDTYSHEHGAAGKLVTTPSSSNVLFRPIKLGTVTLPVDTDTPLKWRLKLDASWAASSAGVLGIDYLLLVPARQRAVSKSGVDNNSDYPRFIGTTGDFTKTINSDLSGRIGSATGNQAVDSGLGGSQIVLPPGTVDFVLWPSSVVPDAPTRHSAEMQLAHTAVTGSFKITPRYFALK